jgi:uncharacterized protein
MGAGPSTAPLPQDVQEPDPAIRERQHYAGGLGSRGDGNDPHGPPTAIANAGSVGMALRGVWRSPIGDGPLLLAAAFAALALVGLQAANIGDNDALSGAVVVFVSIAVEALPFILFGALVSGALAVLVPDSAFSRLSRVPRWLQLPGAALGGMAFPVCECGSVPVARRLALRGVDGSAAITFMLAAPILNPVVLASTAIAFQGNEAFQVTLSRAGIGFVVAVLGGLVLSRLIRIRPAAAADDFDPDTGGDHGHSHHGHEDAPGGAPGRMRMIADLTTSDLLFMGRFVVAGAALAAVVQTIVPTSVLTDIGDSWLLGPIVLMLIAFVLSLCSEADAFVAASFGHFGPGAQIAFLSFGPVLDLKLSFLYGASFGRRFVVGLALVSIPVVLVGSILVQAVVF